MLHYTNFVYSSAPNFRLPANPRKPIIMVGPGTGVAPFRSFWQQRYAEIMRELNGKGKPKRVQLCQRGLQAVHDNLSSLADKYGPVTLFFGCRYRNWELYQAETNDMITAGALDFVHVAYSREKGLKKVHVRKRGRRENTIRSFLIADLCST